MLTCAIHLPILGIAKSRIKWGDHPLEPDLLDSTPGSYIVRLGDPEHITYYNLDSQQ